MVFVAVARAIPCSLCAAAWKMRFVRSRAEAVRGTLALGSCVTQSTLTRIGSKRRNLSRAVT